MAGLRNTKDDASPDTFIVELSENELEKVTGGDTKSKSAGQSPTGSFSLNFTKIAWTYTSQGSN